MQSKPITSKVFFSNRLPALLFSLGLAGMVIMSGCSSEKDLSGEQKLLQEPVLNAELAKEDFSFPSRPPRLSQGQAVFQQNCATCHTAKTISYDKIKNARPIDMYLMLTRGDKNHNGETFKKLTRDKRWESVFYYRHLAGAADIKTKEVAALFGANCAVCHGSKGFADGPLYTGHASAHELGMAPVKNAFDPPPANFHSYSRMYNRTDDELVKFISEGIYPSAMPSWKGRRDVDKNIDFNEATIRDLVKYVRTFAYENDLPTDTSAKPASGKNGKELSELPANGSGQLEKQSR
jgi:mono/diheme cytochrome c family protein